MGYTQTMAFIGGIPEWNKFNYPMITNKEWIRIRVKRIAPVELQPLIMDPEYYILDVRPLNFKRDTSFIVGANHCPLVLLHHHYTKLPRDKKIIIVDWAMRQSSAAAKFLIQQGYPVEGILKGGMERWKSENMPVEERDSEQAEVVL